MSAILFQPQPAAIRKGPIIETVTLPSSWSAYLRISGDTAGHGDIITIGATANGGVGIQLQVSGGKLKLVHSAVVDLHNFGLLGAGPHVIALHWTPTAWEVDLNGEKTSASHEVAPGGTNVFLGKANGFAPEFDIDLAILVEDGFQGV